MPDVRRTIAQSDPVAFARGEEFDRLAIDQMNFAKVQKDAAGFPSNEFANLVEIFGLKMPDERELHTVFSISIILEFHDLEHDPFVFTPK